MTVFPEGSAARYRVAAGLTYVCGHLEEIRAELGDVGADPSTPLQRLLAVVNPADHASGLEPADLAELVGAVHTALVQATGDAWGVYGHGDRLGPTELVGVEGMEIVYRCPLGRCAGRPRHEVTAATATCSISGAGLVRERLR